MGNRQSKQPMSLDELLFLHALWRDLARGSSLYPPRPALPDEVILPIIRHAGFIVPASELGVVSTTNSRVNARNGAVAVERWFSTPAFTHETLAKSAQLQLTTVSEHQGCISFPQSGSWSWFELAIYPASAPAAKEPKKTPDGHALPWRSHCNPVHQSAVGFAHEGELFGPEHEVWEWLEVGDVIGVTVRAQFSGWMNNASQGRLRFWKFSEPSSLL